MCYTGQCIYESSYGDTAGECRLASHREMPSDALCVLIEKEIERDVRKKSLARWFYEYRLMRIKPLQELRIRIETLMFRIKYGSKGNDIPF